MDQLRQHQPSYQVALLAYNWACQLHTLRNSCAQIVLLLGPEHSDIYGHAIEACSILLNELPSKPTVSSVYQRLWAYDVLLKMFEGQCYEGSPFVRSCREYRAFVISILQNALALFNRGAIGGTEAMAPWVPRLPVERANSASASAATGSIIRGTSQPRLRSAAASFSATSKNDKPIDLSTNVTGRKSTGAGQQK